jgi:chromate transporter
MSEPVSHLTLHWHDWLQLFSHYLMLSVLSVGGAISTVPEMHRYLVNDHSFLSTQQFNASISIAQAAPGPNILFVALMGWNVGMNTGSVVMAAWGMFVMMAGILLPSTTITYLTAQWGHRNRNLRAVRAFKQGLAPIVIALLIATGWILVSADNHSRQDWPIWLLVIASTLVVWRTRIHLLWVLGAGALLGWFGLL